MALVLHTFATEGSNAVPLRRVLSFAEVQLATGYSRPSIYRLEKDGRFPRRVKLGDGPTGKVGFFADEIATWLAERDAEIGTSRSATALAPQSPPAASSATSALPQSSPGGR